MTVEELIKELQSWNPKDIVRVGDFDFNIYDIAIVGKSEDEVLIQFGEE